MMAKAALKTAKGLRSWFALRLTNVGGLTVYPRNPEHSAVCGTAIRWRPSWRTCKTGRRP